MKIRVLRFIYSTTPSLSFSSSGLIVNLSMPPSRLLFFYILTCCRLLILNIFLETIKVLRLDLTDVFLNISFYLHILVIQ